MKTIQVNDKLNRKWRKLQDEKPIPYESIVVETVEGRVVDGYRTENGKFEPWLREDVEGLESIRCKRWKYGMIDKTI